MPGPPHEMEPMWNDSVQPRLERLLPGTPAMVALMTFGLGESTVEQKIDDVIQWRPDVTVATYAKSTGVEVHVTARGTDPHEAEELAQEAVQRIRVRLGRAVFGSGKDTLSSVVGRILDERGLSLAVMESCTGGLLASMLTDDPGSSDHFHGGIVAYSREAKAKYGVDTDIMAAHGLISAETALSMASAARAAFDSDIGFGVSGVAGTESVEDKPSGTVFLALDTPEANEVREIHRPGTRELIKYFAAQCSLDLLRRHLETGVATRS
jgi:nicotinamide-nucleotide amidase